MVVNRMGLSPTGMETGELDKKEGSRGISERTGDWGRLPAEVWVRECMREKKFWRWERDYIHIRVAKSKLTGSMGHEG